MTTEENKKLTKNTPEEQNNDKRELEQFVTCRSIDPVLQNVIKMHRMANLKRTSHFHSV